MTTSFRLNLRTLTTELFTGAFGAMRQGDKDAFADAPEGSLIGEIKRGNQHYLCIFDPVGCQFECHESGNRWNENPKCWQVCTITGEIKEI